MRVCQFRHDRKHRTRSNYSNTYLKLVWLPGPLQNDALIVFERC
jgi:hypothetical protein